MPWLLLTAAILWRTQGQFTYALDDPYIQLALADYLRLGSYGINAGEPSAPSGSIVWPSRMAPFALWHSMLEWGPLIVNTACLLGSGFLIVNLFPELPRLGAIALAPGLVLGHEPSARCRHRALVPPVPDPGPLQPQDRRLGSARHGRLPATPRSWCNARLWPRALPCWPTSPCCTATTAPRARPPRCWPCVSVWQTHVDIPSTRRNQSEAGTQGIRQGEAHGVLAQG
jgi:hypothetical protein